MALSVHAYRYAGNSGKNVQVRYLKATAIMVLTPENVVYLIGALALLGVAIDLALVKDPSKPFWAAGNFQLNNACGYIGAAMFVILVGTIWYQGVKTPQGLDHPIASAFSKDPTGTRSVNFVVGPEPRQIGFNQNELKMMKAFLEKKVQKKNAKATDFDFSPETVEYVVTSHVVPPGFSGPFPHGYTFASVVKGKSTYKIPDPGTGTPSATAAATGTPAKVTETSDGIVVKKNTYTSRELLTVLLAKNLIEGVEGLDDAENTMPEYDTPDGFVRPKK